jgi:hypothetical protein
MPPTTAQNQGVDLRVQCTEADLGYSTRVFGKMRPYLVFEFQDRKLQTSLPVNASDVNTDSASHPLFNYKDVFESCMIEDLIVATKQREQTGQNTLKMLVKLYDCRSDTAPHDNEGGHIPQPDTAVDELVAQGEVVLPPVADARGSTLLDMYALEQSGVLPVYNNELGVPGNPLAKVFYSVCWVFHVRCHKVL